MIAAAIYNLLTTTSAIADQFAGQISPTSTFAGYQAPYCIYEITRSDAEVLLGPRPTGWYSVELDLVIVARTKKECEQLCENVNLALNGYGALGYVDGVRLGSCRLMNETAIDEVKPEGSKSPVMVRTLTFELRAHVAV